MPSRFDLTPSVWTPIQWFGVRTWFTSKLGGAFMLLTTAESLPSFHKSPTAKPREELRVVIPAPAVAEMSSNFPVSKIAVEDARLFEIAAKMLPVHFRIDVAVDQQQVRPAIVVKIKKHGAPAEI